MIADFAYQERDRAIFARELGDRLPDRILDNHVHVWTRECLKITPAEYAVHKQYKPWTDFDATEEFTFADYMHCAQAVLPGKRVEFAAFGLPFPQADTGRSNAYVMEHAAEHCRGFYYMPGQFEDIEATQGKLGLLERKGFLGFKPYPDLAAAGQGEAGIYDMLSRPVLEFADRHALVIILHLPRKDRLHSPDNRRELSEILTRYKSARFVLAHVGRAFCYADVEGLIDPFLQYENLWFDTALINDPMVLEYVLERAGSGRVIFGSDAPLAFGRGKDVCINNRHYYVSARPVPWGIAPMREGMVELTYYLYEELRAMLYAGRKVYGRAEEAHLEQVFYGNANLLLRRG